MAEPITVAQLIPSLSPTGPIRVVLDLVKYLDRSRYVPVLVPFEVSSSEAPAAVSREFGVEVRPLNTPWWFGGRTEVSNILTSTDAGLVHVHCYAPMVLAASLRRSIPKMLTLHNWPWLNYRELHGGFRTALMWGIERSLLRRYDAVAPCSKSLALDLQNRGCGPVVPIQNGVDPEQFSATTTEQRAAARRALGIPPAATVFVCVGQLIALKGVLSVLAGYVAAGLDHARLIVVGEGPLAPQCKAVAAGRSDIVIAGFRSDISLMLSAADIYVSASATEGMPLAVLEAYRAGLWLLLSDIPAHREVLEGEAGTGVLYQRTEDLGAVMRREVNRLSGCRHTKAGREQFSSLEMARQYQRVYDRLITGSRCPKASEDSVKQEGAFHAGLSCHTEL